jgi:hypothetical protein
LNKLIYWMKTGACFLIFSLMICISCGIKKDKEVEKDTLNYLKEKYSEEFVIISVSNNTIGHGKGSVGIATGNDFSIQAFPQRNKFINFFVSAIYDSSGIFNVRGDSYLSQLFSKQVGENVKLQLQKNNDNLNDSTVDVYLDYVNEAVFKKANPTEISYEKIILKNPYEYSINLKIDYFKNPSDTSIKKMHETIFPLVETLKQYKPLNIKIYFFFRDEKLRHNLIYKFANSKEPHYFDWINASLGTWQINLNKDELEKVKPETLKQFVEISAN